ncbi:MAG: hypothetical protein QM696_02605 [Steroidobacteraceae bacterium]
MARKKFVETLKREELAPSDSLSVGLVGAAMILRCGEDTVRRLADKGELSFTRDHARRRVFHAPDVLAFARKRHVEVSAIRKRR